MLNAQFDAFVASCRASPERRALLDYIEIALLRTVWQGSPMPSMYIYSSSFVPSHSLMKPCSSIARMSSS